MKRTGMLLLGLLMATSALADELILANGDVLMHKDGGAVQTLVDSNDVREAVLTPDGQWLAYIRVPGGGRDEIWLMDTRSGVARRMLSSSPDADPTRNLTDFSNLAFSANGRQLFFLTSAWPTSRALHRISLTSSRALYMTDANDLRVITRGPKAGSLLVQKQLGEGSDLRTRWCLVSSGGREVTELGDNLEQVLAQMY